MTIISVYGWIPRTEEPFFGGVPTWVYLSKFKLNNLEQAKIEKIIKFLDKIYHCEKYKIRYYLTPSTPYQEIWSATDGE